MRLLARLLIILAAPALFSQEPPAEVAKPTILLCKWRHHNFLDYTWMQQMTEAGFIVDATEDWPDFTWERISRYNAIMLMGLPHVAEGEVRDLIGLGTTGPGPEETLALLDRYMAAGGGVLFNVNRAGQFVASYHAADQALQHYDARLPLELIAAPVTSEGWHGRLRMPFFYTTAIDPDTPVSEGVEGIWWPNSPKGRAVNYVRYSGPLALGESWRVVARGPRGSRTYPYYHPNEQNRPKKDRLTGALQRPEGVPEPPIYAIREVNEGRMALFHCLDVFHVGSGTYWMHNGAMLDKGLGGRKSDFGRLLMNTFRWLAEPSLASGKLGGAVVDPEVIVAPKLRAGAIEAFTDPGRVERRKEFDPDAPLPAVKVFRGLIGARSQYAGGSTPGDYAAAAKAAGLDFVVFLDPFSELTPEELEQLAAECAAVGDEEVLLMPGYWMDSNIGNRMFFYGARPVWPDPVYLSHRGEHLFRLNGEQEDGTFWQKGMGLDFLIKKFMGRENDRVGHNNIGFFDFARAAQRGGMQPEHCKAFGAFGIMFYENGQLREDITDLYLRTNAGCMSALPVVVNLVNSAAELTASVARGDGMTVAVAPSLAEVVFALNKNHQFEAPPVSASSGPLIRHWSNMTRPFIYGNEMFVNARGLVDANLEVTSDVGLAEIAIYDGTRLFRRFLPNGAQRFAQRLYLSGLMQRNFTLVATDTAGGKAVAFPHQSHKAGGDQAVVYCGDHVNHCTNVNMKMARGPNDWRAHSHPEQSDVGKTWDGGPKPLQPLADFDRFAPHLVTAGGLSQGGSPYQYPMLEIGSERVYRGTSVLSGTLEFTANAWRGWGPIQPPTLFDGQSTYTEFGRYVTGVDSTSWGGPGKGGGTVAGLYEQRLRFLANDKLTQFRLTRGRREMLPGTRALLLVGKETQLLGAHDFTPTEDGTASRFAVPAGGWFAGIVTAGEANGFLCFTHNQPLVVSAFASIFDVDVQLPTEGLAIATDGTHELHMLTYMWPMDISLENSDEVLAIIRHLREPQGLEVVQGERKSDAGPGLLEFNAADGALEFTIVKPSPREVKEISPAVRIHGMNPRWSAGLYQLEGYGGAGTYSNGNGQYTPLGVDTEGRTYAPLYSHKVARTHWVVGHPIVADAPGRDLFLQVTALTGPFGKSGQDAFWHVSVNNPTDTPVTATLRQRMALPGLSFPETTLTLQPGEYRLLAHGDPRQ